MATNAEKALEKLKQAEGQEDGVSGWHTIDQAQIDAFANATLDKQFIHVDPEMAAKVSPYKVTIAHGFLTLSMIPYLSAGITPKDPSVYEGMMMAVNYGLDRVRFPSPVKVDSKIRARRELVSATLVDPSTIQLKNKVTIEIEGEGKPACVAETLSRILYG